MPAPKGQQMARRVEMSEILGEKANGKPQNLNGTEPKVQAGIFMALPNYKKPIPQATITAETLAALNQPAVNKSAPTANPSQQKSGPSKLERYAENQIDQKLRDLEKRAGQNKQG